MIPVLNHAMTNRVMDTVCFRIGDGLISDVEVEVLDTAFGGEVAWLRSNRGSAGRRLGRCRCVFARRNRCRKHTRGDEYMYQVEGTGLTMTDPSFLQNCSESAE